MRSGASDSFEERPGRAAIMLTRTDYDMRVASHARQVARVDAVEWMRPAGPRSARTSPRARMGGGLIALSARIVRAAAETP